MEYGFNDVNSSISINLRLRDAGLLVTRRIKGKEYLDYEFSQAFAMVDHQVAHIYIKKNALNATKRVLEDIDGISDVLYSEHQKRKFKINHERSGEIIAIASKHSWFNYYWWYDENAAQVLPVQLISIGNLVMTRLNFFLIQRQNRFH